MFVPSPVSATLQIARSCGDEDSYGVGSPQPVEVSVLTAKIVLK